jgi:predicted RNase H-like HicB family nuclease
MKCMAREKKQAVQTFTAMYARTGSGYMGQLLEWPEVVTEGKTVEECRELLQDALQEMIAAHRALGKEIPGGPALFERIAVVA